MRAFRTLDGSASNRPSVDSTVALQRTCGGVVPGFP